jgi:hypothetical protein
LGYVPPRLGLLLGVALAMLWLATRAFRAHHGSV